MKQGAGTTNTGNVAREFFRESAVVSEIIGVDEALIKRFHSILQCMTCGNMINLGKFKKYTLETAEMCVKLYPWYNMPPSVHRYLIHGSEIMKELGFPCGWFSEEPQESSHKNFRKCRLQNSRMYQRDKTNEDIFHHLLITSDPLLAKYRIVQYQKSKTMTDEAKNLLL